MATDSQSWTTAVADVRGDDVLIRGYALSELVGEVTYTEAVFLVLTGELPTPGQRQMLDAIMVSLIDHGISPSSVIARTLPSCGTPVQAAVGGAALSIGDWHGGSGEQLAHHLSVGVAASRTSADPHAEMEDQAVSIVELYRQAGQRIEGFGHPQHPEGDPRAWMLLDLAEKLGVADRHVEMIWILEKKLGSKRGRRLKANVTGALAALLLDLGFPAGAVRGVVIGARAPGLVAHVVEELEQHGRWRHPPADAVLYTGPDERKLAVHSELPERRAAPTT